MNNLPEFMWGGYNADDPQIIIAPDERPGPIMYSDGGNMLNPASLLFKERILRFYGVVNGASAAALQEQLLSLDALAHDGAMNKDITLYINSPGGNVLDGLMVYDTMTHIKSNISTVVTGMAASMATVFMIAGAKGKRYALPNATIMLHETSSSLGPTKTSQQKPTLDMRDKLLTKLEDIYLQHMNRDNDGIFSAFGGKTNMSTIDDMVPTKMNESEFRNWFHEWLEKDRYIFADQAVELGLIDAVLEPHKLPHYQLSK
ncbi:MAG: ATP-dependent Clp protease proteolytic subunit [archaeon]